MKLWNLFHINPNLANTFQNPPILAFRRSKNLRDIIGSKLIKNGKFNRKFTNKIQGKLHHAYPTTGPCAVSKLYIQQRLEITKRTEYFTSITT